MYTSNCYIWENDTCVKTLNGHTHWVNSVVELPDGRIASGSDDKTVRVWDINTGQCEVLTGHTDRVGSLLQVNDVFISGSSDKSMKVWKNGDCIKTWNCSGSVRALTALY